MLPRRLGWAFVIAATAVACSERLEHAPERPTLRIALPSAPVSLDPHLQEERSTLAILGHVFEALTEFDPDMRLRPLLAASWDNPSDLVWRFRLRPNVVFHDGRPCTASDVVAALERARQHPQSQMGGFLVAVEEVRAIDPLTVEVLTTDPYPLLAARLSFVAIVPAGVPARIEQPVGTGRWRYGGGTADSMVLEPFDEHRDGPQVWGRVELSFVEQADQRARLLRLGEVDLAASLTPESASDIGPGRALLSGSGLAVTFLAMRVDRRPFDDPRLRQAIDLAIDRQRIVREELGGRAVPAGQVTNPAIFGHASDLLPRVADPDAARGLLAGHGPVAAFALEHPPGLGIEAAAIAADLVAVGLEVSARESPWPELYARLSAGDVDAFLAGYACDSGAASDIFDAALHSPDPTRGYGDANFMGFRDPAFDQLVEQANRTLDDRRRRTLLEQASRLAAETLPLVPLWTSESLYGVSAALEWRPRLDRRVIAHEVRPRAPGSDH